MTRLPDWMGRGRRRSGDEDLLAGDEAAQVGGIGRAGLAQCSAVPLQPRVALKAPDSASVWVSCSVPR
jgi:hypothetical protein